MSWKKLKKIIAGMEDGETKFLGDGYSITKGKYFKEVLALSEAERNAKLYSDTDDDSRQENAPGNTENGVKHD